MTKMIEVPILRNYDHEDSIGLVRIDVDALPDDPEYVFSIGYVVLDAEFDKEFDDIKITKHKLICVSLQTDKQYEEYLKSERV